ncbi:hypothetical protein SLEP1_g2017 [Rubroshorea leprosula]|uniref:WAT1-related protein n=1 Tax=Rubroshorea leprosula TaxID=152421 RepID=A0AAV5HR40_9ROSI|nr:hypothetical protein SLEP1_g2017 [Rubroshorea leprosula]
MGEKAVMEVLNRVKPYLAMVSLQFGYAGMYVITMVSFNHGMNHYILAVYRHLVATLVIAPFALVLERKIRPKMTLPIFLRITVLGFLEPVIDQNLYYLGMKYTSATLASATVNVLPAITFILALIFRLESVNLKKIQSIAKVVGTVIMIPGAVIMTFYQGPAVFGGSSHHAATSNGHADKMRWVIGTLMLLARCWGWSAFFILQKFTLNHYPAELSLTTLICFMGTLGGAAVSLVVERDTKAWKIGFDFGLLAAVYSGVVCSGVAYYIQGVVMKERGPVFTTAFSPLGMIITAALSTIILSESVNLGSIIGTLLIIFGLYTVLWGKSKDQGDSAVAAKDGGNALELPVTNTVNSTTSIKIDSGNINKDLSNC